MNIFYLDADPIKAAQMLADEHIRKMQIESAQMLCTTHWVQGKSAPYKQAHTNHPCTIWVRQSIQHYLWLLTHGLTICDEFAKRYDKEHATHDILLWCANNDPELPDNGFTEPPKCMPEIYFKETTIESYRNFYREEKVKFKGLGWRKNPDSKPDWL